MSLKKVHEPFSRNSTGPIHEDRRLQIEALDEWWTHKLRTPDKPNLRQNKLNTFPNQLKVGDIVLLDAADPHIVATTPNEEIPFTVLSIFPFGTVEVSHTKFGTFKVNNTRLKPYFDEIDSRNEEYKLLKPPRSFNREVPCRLHKERKSPYLLRRKGRERHLPRVQPQKFVTISYSSPATVEEVQFAHTIQTLLTIDPCELFFGIIEPTYLEIMIELCSTFHLLNVMMNYNYPGTVQFQLGGLIHQLSVPEFDAALAYIRRSSRRRMNDMLSFATYTSLPRSADTLWPLVLPPTILAAPRHQHVIDLAYFIALVIEHQTEWNKKVVISIGPYVTRLAQHFGLLNTVAQESSLTLIGQMSPLGTSSMLSMRMIEKR
ncbi:hypothetical protein GOBAR_AA12525 [Gossypium barbadense]|uniref:Uncharacterized protein n=1 Tax=Gossypium barbadense TaxID=3634 RepID=A0A2P5XXQ4_GOSBA|nr:hypothetical protein GOBAR_AA12525 [Gossypium barbadense]